MRCFIFCRPRRCLSTEASIPCSLDAEENIGNLPLTVPDQLPVELWPVEASQRLPTTAITGTNSARENVMTRSRRLNTDGRARHGIDFSNIRSGKRSHCEATGHSRAAPLHSVEFLFFFLFRPTRALKNISTSFEPGCTPFLVGYSCTSLTRYVCVSSFRQA